MVTYRSTHGHSVQSFNHKDMFAKVHTHLIQYRLRIQYLGVKNLVKFMNFKIFLKFTIQTTKIQCYYVKTTVEWEQWAVNYSE